MSDDPTNPDDEPMYPDEPQTPEDPDAGHDDIMKRLVDYQRQLREGVEPTEAAAVAWHREPREAGHTEQPEQPAQATQPTEPAQPEPPEPPEAPSTSWGQPAQPDEPAPAEAPSTSWGETDFFNVSPPEPEVQSEAEAVQAEERDEVEAFDQPSDRVEILTSEQAEATPARPWERPLAAGPEPSRTEVSDRIAQLEGTLDRLGQLLGDLRETFQGMAVTADERLAAIEAEIERNREPKNPP